MRINGPYIRPSDGRKFIVTYKEDGSKSTKLYSRYLMEIKLGRPLADIETVDHINGDPFDDRIENLQILSRSDNAKKSSLNLLRFECVCPICNTRFAPTQHQINSRARKKAGPFCSRKCSGIYGTNIQHHALIPISSTLPQEYLYASNDGKFKKVIF